MKKRAKKVNTKQSQLKREESVPFQDECAERLKGKEADSHASEYMDAEKGLLMTHSPVALEESKSLNSALMEDEHYDLPPIEEAAELFWEDGEIPLFTEQCRNEAGVTVEFFESPSSQRKSCRRFSAKEKELAELVHRVHLLCLLGRGRLVDAACNDPLIQASLLSVTPFELLKISKSAKVTTNILIPLVKWFQNNFRVEGPNSREGDFQKNLAGSLGSQVGTAEEVAALSVALMRGLGLPVRFVFALDALPLKPDAVLSCSSNQDGSKLDIKIPSTTTTISSLTPRAASPLHKDPQHGTCPSRKAKMTCEKQATGGSSFVGQPDENIVRPSGDFCSDAVDADASNICSKRMPRKGDMEFEMQLKMALSATAAVDGIKHGSLSKGSNNSSHGNPSKKMKNENGAHVSPSGVAGAVWSRKMGPPIYWAEVFCSGENLTGRWVHVDAAAGVIDAEQKVEAAAAACRKPLRYVVAFAGSGAKDVTRRYCNHWYKIASLRVCSKWWDAVLSPLKVLEANADGGLIDSGIYKESSVNEKIQQASQHACVGPSKEPGISLTSLAVNPAANTKSLKNELDMKNGIGGSVDHCFASRDSLEDLELATRALTEPLPTNQQAYRNHPLYVLERWLTKYQVLHPKDPVLGYCSGLPVYPRGCVQNLHTKQMWLREALQVKENEVPVKVIKRPSKYTEGQASHSDVDGTSITELYGKWQTEPLCLPHAVDGIVPKNERGQVDVWSEKCLPPGTVHLKMPRAFVVAKRLGVDFAHAMVGFEFRNGRSFPIYEGIVVCAEFKESIMEAYAEEEERREAEEKKKREAQALSRWYQLLCSIATRQRLHESYEATSSSCVPAATPTRIHTNEDTVKVAPALLERPQYASSSQDVGSEAAAIGDHEHTFPMEDQSFDEESSVRTKRCPCGFSIQVEEL